MALAITTVCVRDGDPMSHQTAREHTQSRSLPGRIAATGVALALGLGMLLTPATAFADEPPAPPYPGSDSGEAQGVDVFGAALGACGTVSPACAAASGAYTALEGAYNNSF